MKTRLIALKLLSDSKSKVPDGLPRIELEERILMLEHELSIYKQAESIGEIGHWQVNLETFETWYSDNMFHIYGFESQALTAHAETFHPFIHEADKEIVTAAFEKSFRERIPLSLEFRIKRVDGAERFLKIVSNVSKSQLGEPLLTCITQDITEQKLYETQLREIREGIDLQGEALKNAERVGLLGTWQVNLKTRQTAYSENFYRIVGINQPVNSPGLDFIAELLHPDDKIIIRQVIQRMFEDQVAPETELRIVRADGRLRYLQLKGKLSQNADGDPIVIGVLKDVTLHNNLEKQVRNVIDESTLVKETMRQTERWTNIGSWTWDVQLDDVQFSDEVLALFGIKRQPGRMGFDSFYPLIDAADRLLLERYFAEMRISPEEKHFTFRIVKGNGKTRYLKNRSLSITTSEGRQFIIGTWQDVTEEVLLDQQMKERNSFAEMLSENMVDIVCITDPFNNVIGWNGRAEKAFNAKKEDVMGRNVFEIFPRIKKTEATEWLKKVLLGEKVHVPRLTLEYANGSHDLTMIPIIQDNQVNAVLTLLHDVTEYQKLKSDLEERLHFIEKLVESSVDRIIVFDKSLRLIYWNKKSEEYYSLPKENVLDKHALEVFQNFRRDPVYEHIRTAMKGEPVHVPINAEEHSNAYAESYLVPIKNNAQEVVAILWIAHDLTNLIQAKKQIKKQQTLLHRASEIAHLGSWELDLNTNLFIWSDEMFNIYGYPPQSFQPNLQFLYSTTVAEDRELLRSMISKASKGKTASETIRLHNLEGNIKYVLCEARPLSDSDGHILQLMGTLQDITDQKYFEQNILYRSNLIRRLSRLENEEEVLRKAGSFQWNLTSGEMVWSDGLYVLIGVKPFSVQPNIESLLSFVAEEERERVRDKFKSFVSMEVENQVIEYFLEWNGVRKYVRCVARLSKRNEKYVVGSMFDITETYSLQQELENTLDLLRQLVDTNLDTIVGINKELQVIVWNKRAEITLKIRATDAIGKSFVDVMEDGPVRNMMLSNIKQTLFGISETDSGIHPQHSLHNSKIRYLPVGKKNNVDAVLLIIHDVKALTTNNAPEGGGVDGYFNK